MYGCLPRHVLSSKSVHLLFALLMRGFRCCLLSVVHAHPQIWYESLGNNQLLFHKLLDLCHDSLEYNLTFLREAISKTKEENSEGLKNLVSFPLLYYDPKTNENLVNIPLRIAKFMDGPMRVACEIGDKFHSSVREIFEIDTIAKESKGRKSQYVRGPIIKGNEKNYGGCRFPTSTKVGSVLRCSLVFSKCQDCVDAINTLIEVANSEKTCIKAIARIKNR